MVNEPSRKPNPFDRPATYKICVRGRIDPTWSEDLGGMTIFPAAEESDPPVTTLYGEVRDQASLAGVLNTLYELHLTVLSVECVKLDG